MRKNEEDEGVDQLYFIDRNRIEKELQHIEKLVDLLETHTFSSGSIDRLALERLASVLIESIIDVGNQMIDGFIMRDPGGYEDIIDIMLDESVISSEDSAQLKRLIRIRKELAYQYIELDHNNIARQLQESLKSVKAFPIQIRAYLQNELGVITAFIPDEKTKGV